MGRLLLLFIAVPILEIWLLYKVSQALGAIPMLALVIVTGFLGAGLARWQSAGVRARMQGAHAGEPPTRAILEGLLIFVAGVALITPGIITDTVGVLLLIPSTRRKLADAVRANMAAKAGSAGGVNVFTFSAGGGPGATPPPASGGVKDLSADDYEVTDVSDDDGHTPIGP